MIEKQVELKFSRSLAVNTKSNILKIMFDFSEKLQEDMAIQIFEIVIRIKKDRIAIIYAKRDSSLYFYQHNILFKLQKMGRT